MKRNILIIDNYDSFVGNILQLLRESTYENTLTVVKNDAIPWKNLKEYNGILISPGPGIPEEAGDIMKLLSVCEKTHPLLGICLGHQAITEHFGGRLINLPSPLHGHRSRLIPTEEQDPLLQGIDENTCIGRYHSWVSDPETFPESLAVTAKDENGNIMALRHRMLPIHGLQFHPESYISNCGQLLIDNWLKLL